LRPCTSTAPLSFDSLAGPPPAIQPICTAEPEKPSWPCVPLMNNAWREAFRSPKQATSMASGSPSGVFLSG
jgi:hypothetical protein